MNRWNLPSCLVGIAIGLASLHLSPGRQDDEPQNDLTERVARLEQRVEKLESILFATSQLSEIEARRRLEEAQRQYRNTRQLLIKGLATAAQVDLHRRQVEQARLELQMALATRDFESTSARLELTEAEQRLEQARQQLEFTKRLRDRGFATEAQLESERRAVEDAERAVELARVKWKAVQELFDNDGAERSPDDSDEQDDGSGDPDEDADR